MRDPNPVGLRRAQRKSTGSGAGWNAGGNRIDAIASDLAMAGAPAEAVKQFREQYGAVLDCDLSVWDQQAAGSPCVSPFRPSLGESANTTMNQIWEGMIWYYLAAHFGPVEFGRSASAAALVDDAFQLSDDITMATDRGFVTASGRIGTPNVYSVAYEVELQASIFGRSRAVHFNRANAALDEAMALDPAFAAQMEEIIPGVGESVASTGGRTTPTGWIWHHAPSSAAQGRPGVMQLVPDSQHFPGSLWSSMLHPGGSGGYSEWAIPNGAPRN